MIRRSIVIKLVSLYWLVLGVWALYILIKDVCLPCIPRNGMLYCLPWMVIFAMVIDFGFILSSIFTLRQKNWGRKLLISLVMANLLGTVVTYFIVDNMIQDNGFTYNIYPMVIFKFVTDQFFLPRFDDPRSYVEILCWLQKIISVGLPIFCIFFLTRSKVKEHFR